MMTFLLSFIPVFEKQFREELSPYNYFYGSKIILNMADGHSYTLNRRGKILEKSRYWQIPYRGSIYEFEGGASAEEECSSIARLSPDEHYLMAIYGCVKEGYNVEVYGTDIRESGIIVEGALTNRAAFVFVDGVLKIYSLKNSSLLKEYDDLSTYGVGKVVCDREFCLYSDLYSNLVLIDSDGEIMAKMEKDPDRGRNWKSVYPLAINGKYALVGYEDVKRGAVVALIDLENFDIRWRREIIYVEGDNTACFMDDRVVISSGDEVYDVSLAGKINYIHIFPSMWVICDGNYVLTGGAGRGRRVRLLKVK